MEKTDVQRWLDKYVAAWKSYDRDAIAALFAADVEYRYHPYDEPARGRDAVVASWLGEDAAEGASTRDEEGTYDASYTVIAVDGDTAVATGTSRYTKPPAVYHNCFVMSFDQDDRCTRFTEWYMKQPG